MSEWRIHYLNANGQLHGYIELIGSSVDRARERAETVPPPIALDIVVQVWPGGVVLERGHVGHRPTGTMIYLTVDPDNENLRPNLGEPFERIFVHELHHVFRNRGPGYGQTHGEAVVSEGLAGQFVRQIYQSAPEPWEQSLSRADLSRCADAADKDWSRSDYDHNKWFFGKADFPNWAGYSLGYRLVAQFLLEQADQTAASLAASSADLFRDRLKGLAA